ncbi:MAG: hydroxyacid dehydrogenase [Actinobacteria bacterium]|nr:hydroxyacid dehydrogenase [Actinomycetota bacterium]
MRIVIPDNAPPMYPPAGHPSLRALERLGEVTLISEPGANDAGTLVQRLAGATVAVNVRAYARFTAEVLGRLPDLRHVAIIGTGTDNVDLVAATAQGVVVTNTPGVTRRSVAEHALALLFACARNIPRHDQTVRAGDWRHHPGRELHGKTAGVVGLGVIGQEFAKLAVALGLRVIAWSPRHDPARAAACGAELRELDHLYAEADIVSLHVRSTPQTRQLVNASALAKMRDGVILINTARGALIDDVALVAALRSGKVAMAGLDVFDPEPLPPGHPFRELPNVVLTPHAAIATPEANDALLDAVAANIANWAAGRPGSVVNPRAR